MSQHAETPRMATVDPAAQDNYIYNRLLKERIIWLGSEVRDDNANAICSQLLLLSAENPEKDIYLYINSPGGSVTAGMAIYDTMQFIPNDVVTVATGLAASMGQFLLSSGTKGKRYATPNARVLMHQPSGGIGGTASDIKIQAELILHMKKVMAELTADQTGQSVETILKDNDRDKWFTATEALEYGFFDKIAAHAGSVSGGGGTASDIKIQAELILHMKKVMAELTAEQTGQTVETILKDNDRDKWFTAPEALEYGFFDKIAAHAGSVAGGGGTNANGSGNSGGAATATEN